MNCNCNNIYPNEDLNRWSVCQSIDILENYYTKGEVDAKIADIEVDVDLSNYYTKGETNTLLDNKLDASAYTPTDLSGYATEQWVENQGYLTQHQPLKMVNGESLSGAGNIEAATSSNNGYGISILNGGTRWKINALLPIAGEALATAFNLNEITEVNGLNTDLGNYAIGRYNDSNGVSFYSAPYFEIGDGTNEYNRHNIFSILENGNIVLSDYRILQEWLADVEDAANRAAFDVSNKQDTLVSGTNIKTINGQSLLGEGNITISGGGSADLSNYYNKQEIDGFLSNAEGMLTAISGVVDTKADAADTYTKTEVDNLLSNKPDASNVYTKTEVNNLVNNKFACMTQAEYDALAVKENDVLYLIYEV